MFTHIHILHYIIYIYIYIRIIYIYIRIIYMYIYIYIYTYIYKFLNLKKFNLMMGFLFTSSLVILLKQSPELYYTSIGMCNSELIFFSSSTR